MVTIRNKRTGEVRQVNEQDLPNYRLAQAQTTTSPQSKESLLATLLPLLGSLAGGAIGTAVSPGVGTVVGSGAGSGLGEGLRQLLSGQGLNAGRLAGETALGAGGGALGNLFSTGRLLGTAGKVGTEVAGQAAGKGANILQKSGKALRGSVASPVVKASPNFAQEAEDITKFTTSRYSGSAANQAKQMGIDYQKQLGIVKGLTKGVSSPIEGEALSKAVTSNVAMEFDITTGVGKTNTAYWASKIKNVKSIEDLGNLNGELLTTMKSATGDKKRMLMAIQKQISTKLKAEVPEISEPLDIMSQTYKAAPGLKKAAEAKWSIPLTNVKVSTRPMQSVKDKLGMLLTNTGDLAAKSPVSGSQLIGQGVTRGAGTLLGGNGGVPSGYESSPATTPVEEYSKPDATPMLSITKEQVALARLTLPDKQADAIEAAYKMLQEEDAGSGTEAQVARKQAKSLTSQALSMLQTNPNIKTGMIGGPLEQLKSKFSVGDQSSVEFNTLISNLTATIAKARAGTSFTPNEEKMLKQYAPAVGDSRQQLLTKLSLLNSAWEK
jgi:hypothetical protein